MARTLGRSVTLDEAARDWIPKHAADWRSAFTARLHHGANEIRPSESVAGRA
jgi:hypothetical protein